MLVTCHTSTLVYYCVHWVSIYNTTVDDMTVMAEHKRLSDKSILSYVDIHLQQT